MATFAVESPPIKQRRIDDNQRGDSIIDGLPNHIAAICLSLVHQPSLIAAVCSRWRRLLYSPAFPPFQSLYALFVDKDSILVKSSVRFMSFDPISARWDPLPPLPLDSPLCRLLYRHPTFISFNLPIQCVSAAGKLILLAGSNKDLSPALSSPLIFDPISLTWKSGPPLTAPRRWCAAGSCGGAIYVASGIGSQFSPDIAKSMEKLYLREENSKQNEGRKNWEKLKDLRDGRFSREAIDAVGWRGKILMVNAKGDVIKEGTIYDIDKNEWETMPEAMLVGWRGPVAAMEEKRLYSVDETKGTVREYDEGNEEWREVLMEENGVEKLKGAQQVTAVAGKLCVINERGRIVVVDVETEPAKSWNVQIPEGIKPVSVLVLPRMARLEF